MQSSLGKELEQKFLQEERRGDELRNSSLWVKEEVCGCSAQPFLPSRSSPVQEMAKVLQLLLECKDINTHEVASELQKCTSRYLWLTAHLKVQLPAIN